MNTEITFYQRFEADILAGKKTITIRNEDEKDFAANTRVKVYTYESHHWFCDLIINKVEAIRFEQLNEAHAQQENMTLAELKQVIREIYPNTDQLYVISFSLAA